MNSQTNLPGMTMTVRLNSGCRDPDRIRTPTRSISLEEDPAEKPARSASSNTRKLLTVKSILKNKADAGKSTSTSTDCNGSSSTSTRRTRRRRIGMNHSDPTHSVRSSNNLMDRQDASSSNKTRPRRNVSFSGLPNCRWDSSGSGTNLLALQKPPSRPTRPGGTGNSCSNGNASWTTRSDDALLRKPRRRCSNEVTDTASSTQTKQIKQNLFHQTMDDLLQLELLDASSSSIHSQSTAHDVSHSTLDLDSLQRTLQNRQQLSHY